MSTRARRVCVLWYEQVDARSPERQNDTLFVLRLSSGLYGGRHSRRGYLVMS